MSESTIIKIANEVNRLNLSFTEKVTISEETELIKLTLSSEAIQVSIEKMPAFEHWIVIVKLANEDALFFATELFKEVVRGSILDAKEFAINRTLFILKQYVSALETIKTVTKDKAFEAKTTDEKISDILGR